MEGSAIESPARLPMAISRRRAVRTLMRLGLGGTSLAVALKAGRTEEALAAGRNAALPATGYRFVFISHATNLPFFTPTRAGAADACALLGCTYSWTGSESGDYSQMVMDMLQAMEAAITSRVDGIAITMTGIGTFAAPTSAALAVGIPVVAYNVDALPPNGRLAYIGQDHFASGVQMGRRIAGLVKRGQVGLFITAPGDQSTQPRLDGVASVLAAVRGITLPPEVTTNTTNGVAAAFAAVESWWQANQQVRGMFGADDISTTAIIQTVQQYGLRAKGVRCGGYDLNPLILAAISNGVCDFTIDQQPYLQGFYSVLQLYLYRLSGGLVVPEDMNTGSKFVTRDTVAPYLKPNVYQGTSATAYHL